MATGQPEASSALPLGRRRDVAGTPFSSAAWRRVFALVRDDALVKSPKSEARRWLIAASGSFGLISAAPLLT